ncbi:hypothetical protein [Hydrogenophaga sp.]|uniref:YncE family protein n=1 Tax=Hydrogenophaga sp. TaxID=1904254 RepID=UPI0026058FFE|nr:hypothetical protein [Hydrogenophaga sp.]MCW5653227.1 hypothetical protein [Hydrogenophaga sp.]
MQPPIPGAGLAGSGGYATWVWALLRIPLLLVLLVLLRRPLLDLTERYFGIERVTEFSITVLSTPFTRIGLFALTVAVLWLLYRRASAALSAWGAYAATVLIGCGLILALFLGTGTSPWRAFPPMLCLVLNQLPVTGAHPMWSRLMAWGVGVAELFFFRLYWAWMRFRRHPAEPAPVVPTRSSLAYLPGWLITAAAVGGLVGGPRLVEAERALRMPAGVEILQERNINGLALDPGGRYLYVTGHGVRNLQRIDTQDPHHAMISSEVSTGGAQGFAYDPRAGEVYTLNLQTRMLQYFDATTLALRREVPLPDISPGDPWIAADGRTNTLVVASEADERVGSPFIVVDRQSGRSLDKRDVDAGNLLLHPQGSLLYLSFFRNSSSLMVYDLERREFSGEVRTDARVDRMAFDEARGELLLASPLRSSVLRFDARSLALLGEIKSVFGVRVMAIDTQRDWLVSGSLATGQIEIQELATGKVLSRIYLGPWLRSIVVDPRTATAYVSANGALYKVPYGAGR